MAIAITFISYLLVIIAIGIVAYRVTDTMSDYILGGRRLGGAVAALSSGASDMSSWLLMALPGAVYVSGINQIWLPVGLCMGAYLNWQFIGARLRIYTELVKDALTIPEYLVNRFHDEGRFLRIACAVVILIFFTVYMSAGLVAGAFLIEQTFGMNYTTALLLGTLIIMSYTAFGGFLAVSWTDFLQGNLMMIALLAVPLFVMNTMGGMEATINDAISIKPTFIDAFSGISLIGTVSLLSWGLGYFGQPHILVRFMAVKTVHEIPKAQVVAMSWMALSLMGAMLVGFIGMVYYGKNPLANPELIFVALSKTFFSPWITGLIMAAILSSTMCAIDSQMLVASSALTEDLYKVFVRKIATQRELVWVGRLTVLLIAIVAVIIANNPNNRVLKLVSFAWAGLGGSFGAVILLSLYWRRMTRKGAVAGIVSGALTTVIWALLHGGLFDVYELLPAFMISLLFVVGGSLTDKKPSSEIEAEFGEMNRVMHENFKLNIPMLRRKSS